MTKEQIKGALTFCAYATAEGCKKCPIEQHYKDDCGCSPYLATQALKCINILESNNEKLKARLEKAVELPCIVMIEQTIDENGNLINTNKAQAFNGRYGVLYIDRQKWNLPLVDVCTEKVYNSKAAEARLKELKEQKDE